MHAYWITAKCVIALNSCRSWTNGKNEKKKKKGQTLALPMSYM